MGLFSWRTKNVKPEIEEEDMSFLDHLEELRWHLFRALIVVGILAIGFFIFHQEVMKHVFIATLDGNFFTYKLLCNISADFCFERIDVSMQVLAPYEQFMKAMTYAFFSGIIVGFPYLLWEFWRFVKPGLRTSEAKSLRWNVWTMSFLFFLGVAFGYYIILPFSLKFFSTFTLVEGIENNWRIGEIISYIMTVMFGTGMLFELPILIYYLSKMGIVYPEFLRKYRKHAVVIILVLAAILTPPDPITQILIFLPLVGLYEIGIIISARVHKNMRKNELALRKE